MSNTNETIEIELDLNDMGYDLTEALSALADRPVMLKSVVDFKGNGSTVVVVEATVV